MFSSIIEYNLDLGLAAVDMNKSSVGAKTPSFCMVLT